ncbi:aminotransferase class I/II-fold pyridoxal phosphate-dependent enzyme [Salinispira pacifica]|uniref:Aspartate aminotransferase n=1 Tax=Salinispira pacifica TaxID=1307761 RepID=V5WCZ1_9SPIO|nr:aminotransferase class I/II-fold pyridoxal phosphate-dependent enzyme [Salinispira pacifica]AHC13657.1 Aspartate aminotransferase [Salinispira pacifica]
MNPLANELNEEIEHTAVYRMLSELGKKMFFPKGIVAQSAEAKKKAERMNATIGMAYKDGHPYALPLLDSMLPSLSEAEAVSYAPTGGNPRLRELWREQQLARNPGLKGKNATLPMVVAGLTSGIFQMAELFVNPGDRVIVPDMFWGNYKLILSERREAVIDSFPFFTGQGSLNTDGFREQLNASLRESRKNGSRGKVIILLNFPNNPTGYSPTEEEAKQLSAAILEAAEQGNDILTVHDDAYFGLFYEENIRRESLFTDCADLHENVVALKVDGATKEEYAWGFRVAL